MNELDDAYRYITGRDPEVMPKKHRARKQSERLFEV